MKDAKHSSEHNEAEYSLFQMLKPEVIADPYPLYRKMREHEPVHWDPFMHSWVITSYAEVVTVLTKFKAARTPTPEQLEMMGLAVLGPYAEIMLKQMLFLDPPAHTRLRSICAVAFTPRRIESLRRATEQIANGLLDVHIGKGSMDLIADFASPFPATVLATLLGLPFSDRQQLEAWSGDFIELLGNFEHDPDRIKKLMSSLQELQAYMAEKVAEQREHPQDGAIATLISTEIDGARLTDEEIVANSILLLAGALEETTNLIGNGMLSLLRQSDKLAQLRDNPQIIASAIEELLRYESPTQHTGRIAPTDVILGGKTIRKGASLTTIIAAANRDPARFSDPDHLDLTRTDNRHLAFGWAAHYCLGAPLSRLSGQIAFSALLHRLPGLTLKMTDPQWRMMAAMRGILSLQVDFDACAAAELSMVQSIC